MSDETTPTPEPERPTEPAPDASPFPIPPLGTEEKAARCRERSGEMTNATTKAEHGALDPGATPFEQPAIEGIPYERGSEEDKAVRAVIADAKQARRAADGSSDAIAGRARRS